MQQKNKIPSKRAMNVKDFITFALPSIIIISFILICSVAGLKIEGVVEDIFGDFFDTLSDPIGIVLAVVFFPVAIVLFVLFCVAAFFAVPVDMIVNKFFFGDFAVWLAIVAGILAVFGVFRFKLGKWAEDNSYVSGTHIEVTFDSSGKGTAKEVNEYSGDSGIFKNICLFVLRYIAIMGGGIFIFAYRVKRRSIS